MRIFCHRLLTSCVAGAKVYSKKHKKIMDSNVTISAAADVSHAESLVSTFKLACDVWQMLHSDSVLTKGM